jgi:chemotaxis protein MotA
MEKSTLIGVIGGFALIIAGMFVTAFDLTIYADLASVFITIGGSLGALFVATPMARMKKLRTIVGLTFKKMEIDPASTVETLVTFAEKARREGVLSLEDDVEEIPDAFLKKAIQLVVDGTDPEIVKRIMYNEIDQMENRHGQYKKMLDDWGYFAPAFGMIGTLIGLVAMLRFLEDKASIGQRMGVALITTLYGAVLANLVLLPMASKLDLYNSLDILMKEIIVEGVLSIQAGDNPAILRERLNSFIAISERTAKATED